MEKKSYFLWELIKTILISFVIVIIITKFFFIAVVVDGNSMHPNLQDKDIGLSFVITKNFGINRFDTVVVESEKSTNKLVKRVIGLPNEVVEYRDSKLYINGNYVEEPFLTSNVYTEDLMFVLGEDEYLVLGDNREISKDSRYYGPFSKDEFMSSHVLVLWPLSNIGLK